MRIYYLIVLLKYYSTRYIILKKEYKKNWLSIFSTGLTNVARSEMNFIQLKYQANELRLKLAFECEENHNQYAISIEFDERGHILKLQSINLFVAN